MATANVILAHRWFEEVWNQRRLETIDELLTDESVAFSDSGVVRGIQEFKDKTHNVFLTAFPDLKINVEGIISDGDEVAIRWACQGTHLGVAFGIAPTGREVAFRGMSWLRIQNGKLMEGWDSWDQTGLIASLRAPAPEPVGSDV